MTTLTIPRIYVCKQPGGVQNWPHGFVCALYKVGYKLIPRICLRTRHGGVSVNPNFLMGYKITPRVQRRAN